MNEALKNISFKIETIDVAKAKMILTRNKSNRPINEANLSLIASEMKRNNFMFTGQTIIIGANGDLMDGQHRLEAVILIGKPIDFLVVRGVDNAAFKHIDTGKMRSAGDVLSIQNVVNPHSFASIARFIINFQRGGFEKAAGKESNKKLKITNSDISDFVLKRLPQLTEARTYGFAKENTILPGNILSAFYYIFKQIDENDASIFCKSLADGKELDPKDAVNILRKELLSDIRNTRKMEPLEKIALICKAWNFHRKGRKIDVLKWDATKDEFPKPL